MADKQPEVKTLKDLLKLHPDAPLPEEIAEWKKRYEVFGLPLSEKEIFLFRPITRAEHDGIQRDLVEAQQKGEPIDGDRMVVSMCLLWASSAGKDAFERKAGTVSTLQNQIAMRSNFFDPVLAYQMVEEL